MSVVRVCCNKPLNPYLKVWTESKKEGFSSAIKAITHFKGLGSQCTKNLKNKNNLLRTMYTTLMHFGKQSKAILPNSHPPSAIPLLALLFFCNTAYMASLPPYELETHRCQTCSSVDIKSTTLWYRSGRHLCQERDCREIVHLCWAQRHGGTKPMLYL